jgi:hypothetical protein
MPVPTSSLRLALRIALVFVASISLATLGACDSSEDPEVATLETEGGKDATRSPQRRGAEAYYDCLIAAGLPATLEPIDNGDAFVAWEETGHDVLVSTPLDGGMSLPGKSDPDDPAFEDMANEFWNSVAADNTYALMIDGVDHSDTLESCYTESGYVAPGSVMDPGEELKAKQAFADATNTWIECARDNGFPNMQDVTAEVDNWATSPDAVIPLATPSEVLRAALEACPNFDPEKATRENAPDFDWENEHVPDPSIIIEPPPEWSDASINTMSPEVEESADVLHYNELSEILYEKSNEFWESLEGGLTMTSAPE